MEPTRIAFVDLPRMLRDILTHALTADPVFTIVAAYPAGTGLVAAAARSKADVLITALPDAGEDSLDAVVTHYPKVKVLAVESRGDWMFLYELRPQRTVLGEVTPDRVVQLIKGSVELR
jgi:DNA-binding NarL/FixJ family response regulator